MTDLNPLRKILLLLPFFYPHKGGSEKYAEELHFFLNKAHPEISIDILCYNSDHSPSYEEYRCFRIHRVPCWEVVKDRFLLPNPLALIFKLIQLSKNKYAVVNTHVRFFDTAWWAWIYAKAIGAKSIVTAHVASHPYHQNLLVRFAAWIADVTIAKFSLGRYDIITAANESTKDFVQKKLGIKKPIELVHIGVDTHFFQPGSKIGRAIPKSMHPIPDGSVLFTYVGRLIEAKGVLYLLEAFKKLLTTTEPIEVKKAEGSCYLILAGVGDLEDKIGSEVMSEPLKERAFMTGMLAYDEVSRLLGITDVFVNPSFHSEGLPNTLLEAGASGCFVIATNNGSTKDIIRNNDTGYLIPQKDGNALFDAMKRAVDKTEERHRISKELLIRVSSEFDWRASADKYFEIIKAGQ